MLTNRKAVISPGIRDAEGGRADRRVSRMRQRRRLLLLLLRYPLTELCLHTWKLALQDRDAAARRLDVRRDAQRAHAERAVLPGGTHRRSDRHYARGVHADGKQKVLRRTLGRAGSHRVLDDQGVDVEGPGHGCAAEERSHQSAGRRPFLM